MTTGKAKVERCNWIGNITHELHGGASSRESGVAGAPPSSDVEVTVKTALSLSQRRPDGKYDGSGRSRMVRRPGAAASTCGMLFTVMEAVAMSP